MDGLEFTTLKSPERSRTYHFPGGSVILADVRQICVRPSGTHRVETGDGKKHVIPRGWLHLEIDVDEWTF